MALIEFKDLPDTTTPLNASNLNNNFNVVGKEYTTYETTILNSNGNQKLYIKRIGRLVELFYEGDINSIPSGSFDVLTTPFPAEFRPISTRRTSVERSLSTIDVILLVYSNGTIGAYNYSSAVTSVQNFQFNLMYFV